MNFHALRVHIGKDMNKADWSLLAFMLGVLYSVILLVLG